MAAEAKPSEPSGLANKLLINKEYFPIDISFGDKEKIRIQKRPRKGVTDIVDITAIYTTMQMHIGMFVGIQKEAKILHFGPAGVNKSHMYRNIPQFVFVKLLEYYGLNNVDAIIVDVPENKDYQEYLSLIGFIPKNKRLMIELGGVKLNEFIAKLEKNPVEIRSQVGQLEEIILANLGADKTIAAKIMADKIVDKIKNMDPLGKKFWDNRRVAQINTVLSTAIIHQKRLYKDEFIETAIKTIVSSFETYVREAYLDELIDALEGKKPFSMPYIQKMIDEMKILLKDQIKAIKRDHYHHWLNTNMPAWKLSDKNQEGTRLKTIADSQLKMDDFGPSIKDDVRPSIQSLIDHYNGLNLFFGVPNRM